MRIKDIIKANTWKLFFLFEAFILGLIVLVKMISTLESYTIPVMSGTPDIGEIYAEGGYYTFDQDDDAPEALALDDYIPFHINMPVKAGSYEITIDYKSSSCSTLRLFSPSDQYAVQCDDFMLYENKEQLTSNLIVKHDVEDLDICVKYGGYGWFDVRGITLQENHRDVLPLVIKCLIVFVLFDVGIWLKKKQLTLSNCEKLRISFILVSFAVIASLPMFAGFLPVMDDFAFSFVRIEGIKDAILEGQIPAIVLPNSLLGYGYADPVFYPNILLYFPAAMRIIGFNFMKSYKTFVFLIHLLTAVIAYYSVSKIFKSSSIGLFGSFIYTFSIYRLVDVYRRAAVGEFCAIAFLPLVVYGLYYILTKDVEDKDYRKSWIPLTIGLWGVANTHILSCEMAAVFIIPICLICVKRVFVKVRLAQLLKAVGITVLLSAYFWVPFIDMSLRDSYKVFANEQRHAAENSLSFFQTFSMFFSQVGSAVGFTEGNPPRDLGIGFVFLVGSLLFIYLRGIKEDGKNKDDLLREKFLMISLVFGCVAVWMTTYHFPWSWIGHIGGVLKRIFFMVQFPWRYTAIATVLLLFVLCEAIRKLMNTNKMAGGIVLSLFIVLVGVQSLFYFQSVPREGETLFYYEEAGLPMSGGNGYGEYEPTEFQDIKIGYNIWQLQEVFNNSTDAVQITAFDRYGTDSVLTVNNLTAEEQKVYLPILYYPGYVAFDIFSNEPIEMLKSEKGTLCVTLPAGYMSAVKIEYHISWIYRVGELISICSCFYIIFVNVKKRKLEKIS